MKDKRLYNLLLLVPFLVVFSQEQLFLPYARVYGGAKPVYEQLLGTLLKVVPFLAMFYVFANFYKLKSFFLRGLLLIVSLYFVYLVFESLYYYESFVEFPHVFLKWLNLFVVVAFVLFYQNKQNLELAPLMNIILIFLAIKIATNPSMVSFAAFVSHVRLLPSDSTLLLLLPCLYFFNSYLTELRKSALLKFFILLFFIIYFQHRSVWMATLAAFTFNFLVLAIQRKLPFSKFVPYLVPLVFLGIMGFALVTAKSPEISEKISMEIGNILNPEEDKTGSWRIEQMESYWPYVKQNIVEGLRLKGFELPVQFFHEAIDEQIFEANTGHHFHSFYFDTLFYFGIAGILIFIAGVSYPVYLTLRNNLTKDYRPLVFVYFVFGSLVYGFAYNLPLFFWGVLGLAIVLTRRKLEDR